MCEELWWVGHEIWHWHTVEAVSMVRFYHKMAAN